jgi:hypothetical protein
MIIFSEITGLSLVMNIQDFIELCSKYINSQYEEMVDMIVWSLTHLLKESDDVLYSIANSNILKKIIDLSKSENCSVSLARTITWFYSVLMKYDPTRISISTEIIQEILIVTRNLLDSNDEEIQFYSIWTFSGFLENMISGSEKFLIQLGIIDKIMSMPFTKNNSFGIITFFGGVCSVDDDEILNVKYF